MRTTSTPDPTVWTADAVRQLGMTTLRRRRPFSASAAPRLTNWRRAASSRSKCYASAAATSFPSRLSWHSSKVDRVRPATNSDRQTNRDAAKALADTAPDDGDRLCLLRRAAELGRHQRPSDADAVGRDTYAE
jgi:hypothetical protein